jgi:peptide chain release factor 2
VIHFDISKLENELKNLEEKTTTPNFWEDSKNSNIILSKIKSIKSKTTKYRELESEIDNILELIELLKLEYDEELGNEMSKDIKKLEKSMEKFEIETLLSGKYDKNNAILTLHPGAGGTEAQDWAEMLYRMYSRWANKSGYKVEELDFLEGDEAGLKSVTFEIIGENAYGYLKGEMGVHRLVRISPFDSGGRRHTSFASLEVLPEITDDVDLYINPDDIKMDVYRASGAGGQHVNKTSSAVRLTHIPTGIITSCQTQRSQLQNREYALKMLKSKLLDLKEREHKETIEELKGVQRDIAWGSQIRSYVFCPYTLVKDHRTNYEIGNVQSVMDGELDGFIESYLKQEVT